MIVIEGKGSKPSETMKETEICYTLTQKDRHIIIEHHPHDSRTTIAKDQKNIQSLSARMGTGGE